MTMSDDPAFQALDDGERSALTLGLTLGAKLILIDDRKGAVVALQKGFQATGTLGLLTRSAQRGLLDLADALAALVRHWSMAKLLVLPIRGHLLLGHL